MKAELRELSDGQVIIGEVDDAAPLEIEESFLEYVLAFEKAEMVAHRTLLHEDGVVLPAAEELADEALTEKLWEVIHALAAHRIYLHFTDHLDDRELYSQLCAEILDGTSPMLSPESETNCRIDLLGSGSAEDTEVWLTHYASDRYCADWHEHFPEDSIPPHQDPTYDRDRHLPIPPEKRELWQNET